MRWPWQRTETRASFTDAVVEALLADASDTSTKTAAKTAALEAVAGIYAAAFARAVPDPEIPALTPACLALIARDLIRRGESIHLIETEGGLHLRPVGSWDVRGAVAPASWYVRCDLYGPTANVTRIVPHAAVVHCRYSVDPARPWLGVGPMQWATATATLAGRLESGLAKEAGAKPAQLVPIPADGGDGSTADPLAKLKADIAAADGRAVLLETTSSGWDKGTGAAPRRDWEQRRIGFDPPAVLAEARRDLIESVANACNVPSVLLDSAAEGTSQREGLRRFAHLGLEPLGAIVAAELAEKLDVPNLRLDFSALMASDLAGRARAFKALTEGGLSRRRAMGLVGLG